MSHYPSCEIVSSHRTLGVCVETLGVDLYLRTPFQRLHSQHEDGSDQRVSSPPPLGLHAVRQVQLKGLSGS